MGCLGNFIETLFRQSLLPLWSCQLKASRACENISCKATEPEQSMGDNGKAFKDTPIPLLPFHPVI